jgi:hypothetical protein
MKMPRYVFALFLLLTLLPACGLRAPEFIDYRYSGFSIALPTHQPSERSEQGPDGTINSISGEAEGFKYAVIYWDLPLQLRGISDQQIFDSMSLGTGAWKVIKQKGATLAGMQCLEIEGETANGKYMVTRMLHTKDRVYLLTVGGTESLPAPSVIKRFFSSFRLDA